MVSMRSLPTSTRQPPCLRPFAANGPKFRPVEKETRRDALFGASPTVPLERLRSCLSGLDAGIDSLHKHRQLKQAETVMQAAGLKAIVGPAVNLSLCSFMPPPEIAAILYACRHSEA